MKNTSIIASLFSIVLGLSGLGQAWRVAARMWRAPLAVGEAILCVATFVWLGLMVAYARNALRQPEKVVDEFRHSIAGGTPALLGVSTFFIVQAMFTLFEQARGRGRGGRTRVACPIRPVVFRRVGKANAICWTTRRHFTFRPSRATSLALPPSQRWVVRNGAGSFLVRACFLTRHRTFDQSSPVARPAYCTGAKAVV